MHLWQSIILGIVEGATEFLPVSSTAHLMLASKVMNFAQTEFVKSFEITIQLGAILAVVWLYWRKFLLDKETIKRVVVAFLPTAIIGFLLYKIFKNYLLENFSLVALMLVFGGMFLIGFEYWYKVQQQKKQSNTNIKNMDTLNNIVEISYEKCFIIGICQSLAIVPGVSRSAATILGGLFLGVDRKTIVEFSFLLAVPTMLAATGYDMFKSGFNFLVNEFWLLALGFIISFIVALVAVKFLIHYISRNDFKPFGWYRIAIGIIFILFFIL